MTTQQGLVQELDRLRRRAAHGSQRPTVSIDRLARLTGIPRSTVHAYVSGIRLPPPDVLDVLVSGLGATRAELRSWADALDRITESRDGDGRGSDPALTRREAPPVPHQLPGRPTGFLGRDAELRALDELTAAAGSDPDATRVFTVTGTGGVGKTALVLTWAHRTTDLSPDGQLWVDLRGFGPGPALDPGDALEEMLRAVGVNTAELPTSVDARAALFRTGVAGRRMLIVLDNARDAAHVRPLLPGSRGIVTVVTSRNTLRSLVVDGAARVQLARLGRAEARSLLVADLPAELAGSAAMTRIVDRCEGLPLTLRIVRERLAGEPAAEAERIAVQFERDGRTWLDEFDLPDDADDVSMRAALRWSYEALSESAARAFRMLPLCLVPTIDVRCIAALLDTDLPTARRQLETLVAANLLERGGSDAYRVHDLVMAFAAETRAAAMQTAETTDARRRLWRALAAIGELAVSETDRRLMRIPWPDGERPDDLESEGRIERLLAPEWLPRNIEAYLAVTLDALRAGDVELGWVLAERGFRTLRWVADAGRMATALMAAAEEANKQRAVVPAIAFTRMLGVTCGQRGQFDDAEALFTRAIGMAESIGAELHVAIDRQNRAYVWGRRGELTRSIDELTEVSQLDVLSEADRIPVVQSLIDFHLQRGDLDVAEQLSSSLAVHLEFPHEGEAHHLTAELAEVRIAQARGEQSTLLGRLAAIEGPAVAKNNREVVAEVYIARAAIQLGVGDLSAAEESARSAVAAADIVGSRSAQVRAQCGLADVLDRTGRFDDAHAVLEQALDLAVTSGHRYEECEALISTAQVLRSQGQLAASVETAGRALGIAKGSEYRILEAAALALARGGDDSG